MQKKSHKKCLIVIMKGMWAPRLQFLLVTFIKPTSPIEAFIQRRSALIFLTAFPRDIIPRHHQTLAIKKEICNCHNQGYRSQKWSCVVYHHSSSSPRLFNNMRHANFATLDFYDYFRRERENLISVCVAAFFLLHQRNLILF